jgi:hypothetical protein
MVDGGPTGSVLPGDPLTGVGAAAGPVAVRVVVGSLCMLSTVYASSVKCSAVKCRAVLTT